MLLAARARYTVNMLLTLDMYMARNTLLAAHTSLISLTRDTRLGVVACRLQPN